MKDSFSVYLFYIILVKLYMKTEFIPENNTNQPLIIFYFLVNFCWWYSSFTYNTLSTIWKYPFKNDFRVIKALFTGF